MLFIIYGVLFLVDHTQVLVQEWDVESGCIVRYPLMDWIGGEHYLTRVLIITRDSDKGKTQIAKAMLACLAGMKQDKDIIPRQDMLVVQTVEGLSAAAHGGFCHEWVCILLDEIRPGQCRGTRPAMSIDEVKKLCMVDIQTTFDARNKDAPKANTVIKHNSFHFAGL